MQTAQRIQKVDPGDGISCLARHLEALLVSSAGFIWTVIRQQPTEDLQGEGQVGRGTMRPTQLNRLLGGVDRGRTIPHALLDHRFESKSTRLGCLVLCAGGRGKAFGHHRTRRLELTAIEGEERRRDQRASAKSVLRVGRSGKRVFEPTQPFGPMSPDFPESRKRGTESEPERGIPVAQAPSQSGSEVVELRFDAVEPARLIRPPEHRLGSGLGKVREPLGVLAPEPLRLRR